MNVLRGNRLQDTARLVAENLKKVSQEAGKATPEIERLTQALLAFYQIDPKQKVSIGALVEDVARVRVAFQDLGVKGNKDLDKLERGVISLKNQLSKIAPSVVQERIRNIPRAISDPAEQMLMYKKELQNLEKYRATAAGLRTLSQERRQEGGGKEPGVGLDEKFYKTMSFLGPQGVDNLRKQLTNLGLSTGRVVRNITEVSDGITSLRVVANDGAGHVRQFSFHVDKAGNILQDTQKRFRSFGDAIARDAIEVLKWTIAVGLIYGPIRKLNDLLTESIEIQSKLTDVQITLGRAFGDSADIFSAAAKIADETSSTLAGVISGFDEAIAATGAIENPSMRSATAQALLRDSMILSKLAGIEQSQALDTLVGALRQAGRELFEGQKFLDSWVAVSRNANVSLNQLASTFAIVGTAAEDVGITYDQLNGIVGALAEATKLSADETGNAIRGFISGFQSAKAESTLAKFGIAVRTTSGEVRSFTSLLEELSALSQAGVLTERATAEITNVIGGGFRRGAQLAALLQNYNRVLQLTEVSQNANGQAADALELKMSTLESGITRLNNAFSSLAQTLGNEGGALGSMSAMVDMITLLIKGVDQLVSVLGSAAPFLATLGIIGAVSRTGTGKNLLSGTLPTALAYMFAPSMTQMLPGATVGPGGANPKMPAPGMGLLGGQLGGTSTWAQLIGVISSSLNKSVSQGLSKIPLAGGALSKVGLGGLIGPGVMIGTQLASGDGEKALATAAGTFLGALTGNPLLATAGAIMASGFYDKFLSLEGDISARWAENFVDAARQRAEKQGAPVETEEETTQEALARLNKDIIDSASILERFWINSAAFNVQASNANLRGMVKGAGVSSDLASLLPQQGAQGLDIITAMYLLQKEGTQFSGRGGKYPGFGGGGKANPQDQLNFLLGGAGGGPRIQLDQETQDALDEVYRKLITSAIKEGVILTPTQRMITKENTAVQQLVADVATTMVEKALKDIAQGTEGGVQAYIDYSRIADQYASAAASLIVSVTKAQEEFPTSLKVPSRQEAVGLVSAMTPEEALLLTQITGEITNNLDAIKELSDRGLISEKDVKDMEQLKNDSAEAVRNLERFLPAVQQAAKVREAEKIILAPRIEVPENLTPEQLETILMSARAMWIEALRAMNVPEELIQAWVAAQQQKLIEANGQVFAGMKTNVPQEYVSQAADKAGLGGGQQNFQFMDLRQRMGNMSLDSLMARYNQVVNAFKANVPGFELDLDPVTLILKDGFHNMQLDMQLFNLAMQELIDIEEDKTVEGMFNLPGGSTFFVPFEPAALDARSRETGGTGLDMSSLFAQYAADVETSTREGARQGIIEAFERHNFGEGAFKREPTKIYPGIPQQLSIAERAIVDDAFKRHNLGEGAFENYPKTGQAPGFGRGRYGGMLPQEGEPTTSLWELLQSTLEGLKTAVEGLPDSLYNLFKLSPDMSSGTTPQQTQQMTGQLSKPEMSTKLALQINSTTQLLVDGRMLATIIKPYLYEDMLRFEGAISSLSRVVTV